MKRSIALLGMPMQATSFPPSVSMVNSAHCSMPGLITFRGLLTLRPIMVVTV